jgi:hypothetical protein
MVQGLAEFNRRWGAIPAKVRASVQEAMERYAEQIVGEMDARKPLQEIEIGWTWGGAPAGAVTLGKVATESERSLRITIYATAATEGGSFPSVARWFEFGTAERVQKTTGRGTGRIAAQPYFFPTWRARRTRVRGGITRAMNKAIREV